MQSNSDFPPSVNDNAEPPHGDTETCPARMASIVTAVLLQLQGSGQSGTHDLRPYLIALIVVLATLHQHNQVGG